MGIYWDNLCQAMSLLAEHPRSVFIGQAVRYSGTAMYNSLKHIPENKRIELPVFENTQLGMAIGASLNGDLPICIYPRINFLLEATSQLVSHLDKLSRYSDYRPKVIIRTAVAHSKPLNPGIQHLGDYTWALAGMLTDTKVYSLENTNDIISTYQEALAANNSSVIIEHMRYYDS
jgi:pyruvate/2-oxoglutarate/acetoin dehydrogenase E1 component